MIRKLIFALVSLLLVSVLAACDSGTQATPTPPIAPTSAPKTTGMFIAMETTGGVAGQDTHLGIGKGTIKYNDGKNAANKNQPLSSDTYNAVVQQINAADFFNLKDAYDNGGVVDDVYYIITVQDDTRSKSVKVAQQGGKDITPKPLQDLITQLNNLQSTLAK